MIKKIICALIVFLVTVSGVSAQTGSVKGNIVDGDGLPLIGANVVLKATTTGSITDLNGNFTVTGVPVGEQVIVASFIGYNNEEKVVTVLEGETSSISFKLIEDVTSLAELVVIGYGTVKKEDATGSVTAIKPDEENRGLVTNTQDLLAGKIAGVNIISEGGTPGGNAKIRIRGGSSLNASHYYPAISQTNSIGYNFL